MQTNVPRPGDGYDTGTWRSEHIYDSAASLPNDICVITYDLGFGRPPTPHRLNFDNNDNSVQWALFKTGSWDMTTTDDNCATLPPPVPAPPVPPTTQPPPVKTVSHTSPPHVTPPKTVPSKPQACWPSPASAGWDSSWPCWASSSCSSARPVLRRRPKSGLLALGVVTALLP